MSAKTLGLVEVCGAPRTWTGAGASGGAGRAASGGAEMDNVVSRFARELADAIAAAVAESAEVESCRAKAREAGFEMRVTLEAVVGFMDRANRTAVTRITTPARMLPPKRHLDLSANDRRFLRSLRIAADEAKEAVE